MVNFVHCSNSNDTLAPVTSRVWNNAPFGAPVITACTLVADVRAKFRIHPKSIQGAGGASGLKPALAAGSKIVGVPVTRATGAK